MLSWSHGVIRALAVAAGLAVLLDLSLSAAHAQVRSSANYAISADEVNAGGGTGSSASYTQRASAGLAFATPPMVGTNYPPASE